MQPRVTVALATVWLTVAVLVGGAVTLRVSHDQYSPASPRRHAEVQQDHTGDWRDHDPAEDQPLDLWINSRRSISTEEALSRNAKFTEQDFPVESLLKDVVSSKRIYPFSGWQRRLPNIAGAEFAADKVDYGYEMPETLSRETVVSPSNLLDDPFVADDTFQDQGPGSMEIYKLDLSKEKTLLTATTPSTNLLSGNKNKAPKKTSYQNSKTKTGEIKSITTSANVNHRQSNFFEEHQTETPLINRDAFDVGGVPELQVGCEGLEASSSHKTKRSIDTPDKEKGEVPASVLLNVSPVSLDLDDDLSYDEEQYEEMDELFKLKKMETTTKRNKPNRGDMDASHLNSDHLVEFRRPEKLPVRGDLGESIQTNSSGFITDQKAKRFLMDIEIKKYEETKPKQETIILDDDDGTSKNHGRRLLWLAKANEGFMDSNSKRKRTRRSIDWGFGENEGVVSSDELETVNERRRQHEMRYHQDSSRRHGQHYGLNNGTDSIRQEKLFEQKRREEEEYFRQMQQANRRTSNKWEEEEKRRRDEMRRRQYEEYRRRMDTSTPRVDNEEVRRQMEERQRQEAVRNRMQEEARRNEEELRRREEEERKRRLHEEETKRSYSKWQEENLKKSGFKTSVSDEEKKRRLHYEEIKRQEKERRKQLEEEEAKRQEQYRLQQEAQRKREEEERRRQDPIRNPFEDDRRRLEDRRREWLEKRRQEDKDERKRQQPSNLMRAEHPVSHPNDIRQRNQDEKRRQQEETQREQKLREYIARNRPINVNHIDRRSEEERRRFRPEEHRDPRMNVSRNDEEYLRRVEEQRRRQEEERKLQDYIRRNQPVNVPSRDNQSTAAGRNWFEQRRLIEEARHRGRYPDPGAKRDHGPSAPTYIDPWNSPEEVRRRQQEMARRWEEERRQRYEAEERRKELERRQWEEKEERRLHEERMRKEAARREEETRREQSRRYEQERKRLERERIQAERWRQELLKQRSRNEVGRTKRPEVTRPIYYQDPRLLEHRRRQDSRPIPSNLMRAEEARRAAAERERQRLEAERRQQEESRMREHRQKETDQWRRQEQTRLNSLPVNARIIVLPGGSSTSPISPSVLSRDGFGNEIDFTGINPNREGVQVAQFPVAPTSRPPAQSPSPCVWAVVHCCSSNNNRLVKCFESLGCPGINWDPNPCRGPVADAAREEVLKFYTGQ